MFDEIISEKNTDFAVKMYTIELQLNLTFEIFKAAQEVSTLNWNKPHMSIDSAFGVHYHKMKMIQFKQK